MQTALENLALRQQLAVLRRSAPKRLKLTPADRIFWVWLGRVWGDWKSVLMIVKAETVELRATTTSTGNTNPNALLIGTPLIQLGPSCSMRVTAATSCPKKQSGCTNGWMRSRITRCRAHCGGMVIAENLL
jgi:hypothetical protein